MNDDRPNAHRTHQDDVFGEQPQRRPVVSSGENVAAVLDDDDLSPEPFDVGKRLYQYARFRYRRERVRVERIDSSQAHGYRPIVARPVVSSIPSARFAHWIIAPLAPLVRLSIAAITIT